LMMWLYLEGSKSKTKEKAKRVYGKEREVPPVEGLKRNIKETARKTLDNDSREEEVEKEMERPESPLIRRVGIRDEVEKERKPTAVFPDIGDDSDDSDSIRILWPSRVRRHQSEPKLKCQGLL